ncbi:MAG: hypothetical protein BM556_14940 [Bacteriovorax sp. MedPE-SWde]|nr:MAG: hypothetical protein BM556_14940 [Bacteriovorax sp. MedPE-SWde]
MQKIIMIDDDKKLCDKLSEYFDGFQLSLSSFQTSKDGLDAIKESDFSVLILDGMLPDMDGFEVCKEVRKFSDIPIIFLTGRVEETDKILGLEYGADDYVTKPFSARELVARVKSQIRRIDVKGSSNKELESAGLTLNPGSYTASYMAKDIDLTATEFEILKFLFENKGETKSREEIMEGLYGDTWEAFDRSLDIAISRIRKKLKSACPDVEFIKTVRLKGYIFVDFN